MERVAAEMGMSRQTLYRRLKEEGVTFAGLLEEVRRRLTDVDYSRAEQACPHGLAIAKLMRQAKEILA